MLADGGQQAQIARMMRRDRDEAVNVLPRLIDAAQREQTIEHLEADRMPGGVGRTFQCLAEEGERLLPVADAGVEGAVAPDGLDVRRRHAARLAILDRCLRHATHAQQAQTKIQKVADVAAIERDGPREMRLRLLEASLRLDGDAKNELRLGGERVFHHEALRQGLRLAQPAARQHLVDLAERKLHALRATCCHGSRTVVPVVLRPSRSRCAWTTSASA